MSQRERHSSGSLIISCFLHPPPSSPFWPKLQIRLPCFRHRSTTGNITFDLLKSSKCRLKCVPLSNNLVCTNVPVDPSYSNTKHSCQGSRDRGEEDLEKLRFSRFNGEWPCRLVSGRNPLSQEEGKIFTRAAQMFWLEETPCSQRKENHLHPVSLSLSHFLSD